jgi:hypothetical protein
MRIAEKTAVENKTTRTSDNESMPRLYTLLKELCHPAREPPRQQIILFSDNISTYPTRQLSCATNDQSPDETFKSNSLTTATGITKMSWHSTQLTIDSWHSEKDIRRPQRIAVRASRLLIKHGVLDGCIAPISAFWD